MCHHKVVTFSRRTISKYFTVFTKTSVEMLIRLKRKTVNITSAQKFVDVNADGLRKKKPLSAPTPRPNVTECFIITTSLLGTEPS